MTLTLQELKERIARYYDVVTLCEVLQITEEELLERFEDRVFEHIEELQEEMYDGIYDKEVE